MTRPRVRASFARDLNARLLRRHGETEWIPGLAAGLREARALLTRHTGAGTAMDTRPDGTTLRRLVLRRVPYVIWYVVARGVWLVRLFHARQERQLAPGRRPATPRRRPS